MAKISDFSYLPSGLANNNTGESSSSPALSLPGGLVSAEVQRWLNDYCLAVLGTEEQGGDSVLPASLKPRLAKLEIEPDGDYTAQIEALLAGSSRPEFGQNRPTLVELSQSNRCNILLGKAGSGKSYQLRDLFLRQTHLTLAQLEQAGLTEEGTAPSRLDTPLFLPIYLSLGDVALKGAADQTGNSNLFQATLEAALQKLAKAPLPANLFNQVVPLVLADNLERLDPAFTPVFLYNFKQWFGSVAPETRIIIGCRHLNFMLYYPWFKAEQNWQFHALYNFDWVEVRTLLSDKFSTRELDEIEQAKLTRLFTNPALGNALYRRIGQGAAGEGMPRILQLFLDVVSPSGSENTLSLARLSNLLDNRLIAGAKFKDAGRGFEQPAGNPFSLQTPDSSVFANSSPGQAMRGQPKGGEPKTPVPNIVQGPEAWFQNPPVEISGLAAGPNPPAPQAGDFGSSSAHTQYGPISLDDALPAFVPAGGTVPASNYPASFGPPRSEQSASPESDAAGTTASTPDASPESSSGAKEQTAFGATSVQKQPIVPASDAGTGFAPLVGNFAGVSDASVSSGSAFSTARPGAVLERALALGITEKHPIAGWVKFTDPALDRLLTAWFCLQLAPDSLPDTISRVLATSLAHGSDCRLLFLRLLYQVTPPVGRNSLFTALLCQPPDPARLDLIIEMGQVETNFAASWRSYLLGLLGDPLDNSFGQQVLKLVARLGQPADDTGNPPAPERLVLAEIAFELLGQSESADAELFLNMGRVQEQLGKYNEALTSYRAAHQNPGIPALESTLGIARLLTHSGSYDDASFQLTRLNRRLLDFQAEILNQLSVVRRQQKNLDGACECARQAAELDNRPAYRHNLALALYEKGDRDMVEQELIKLTEEHPTFAEGFYDLGRVQLERGANDLALVNLRRAVELSSTTARYLYDLGRSLLLQQRYEEAHTYLRAAVVEGDTHPDYQSAFGLAALKLNRIEEACGAFLRAIDLSGDKLEVDVLVYLAAAEYTCGSYTAATNALNRARNLDPGNARLHLLTGLVAEADGKIDTAVSHYREALASKGDRSKISTPQAVALHLGLARCLRLTKNFEEAARQCREIAELESNSPEMLYEAGQLALARKAFQDAADLFGKGLVAALARDEASQDNPAANSSLGTDWLSLFNTQDKLKFELPYNYALTLRELGQHIKAQQVLYGQLKSLAQDDRLEGANLTSRRAAVYNQLGLSLLASQDNQKALQYLSLAVADEPKNAAYHLGEARALIEVGGPDRAMSELNTARELDPMLSQVYAEIADLQLLNRSRTIEGTLFLSSLNLYFKALAIEPENPLYLHRAALLAFHLRYQNQATELIGRLLAAAPAMADAHLLAACNLERNSEMARAREEIALAFDNLKSPSTGYAVVAARLARKVDDLETLEKILNSLKDRTNLPLQLQSAIWAEEGWLALSQKHYSTVADYFRQAIELFQLFSAADTPLNLEEIYHEDGSFGSSGSGSTYQQALLSSYKVALALALHQLFKNDQALLEVDEALKLNSQNAEAQLLKGELLTQLGQYQPALDSLRKVAELEPTPSRFYELGQLYLKLGETQAAVQAFKQAGNSSEITSKSEYHANLGQAYEKGGNSAAARASYTRSLQIEPNNPDLHLALARCYLNGGDRMAAVQPMQGAVVAAPENPAYRFELAHLYEELGWLQEATSEYESATQLNPSDPRVWLKSGQVLMRIGRAEQARNALEQAVTLDDGLAEAHYELGKFYLNLYQSSDHRGNDLPPDLYGMYGGPISDYAA